MSSPDWLTTQPIAHRGLHDAEAGRPENSLAAFEAAADAGYPIELDVRLSANGQVVVFHDDTLDRMTGESGPVSRLWSDDLTKLTLLDSDQKIPLLEDVLTLVAGRVPLIVEIKNVRLRIGRLEAPVARLLERYGGACAVSSFNVATVAWCARQLPKLPRGQNVMRFREGRFLPDRKPPLSFRQMLANRALRPQFIGCTTDSLPHPTAQRLRERGVPLLVFTVRDEEQRALAMTHADNIFFEGFIPQPDEAQDLRC